MPPARYTLPALSLEQVRSALQLADKNLSARRLAAFRGRLNSALSTYVVLHIRAADRRAVTPSKLSRLAATLEAAAMAANAKKVETLLERPVFQPLLVELWRAGLVSGDVAGKFATDGYSVRDRGAGSPAHTSLSAQRLTALGPAPLANAPRARCG
jgi:hypothetical protein